MAIETEKVCIHFCMDWLSKWIPAVSVLLLLARSAAPAAPSAETSASN